MYKRGRHQAHAFVKRYEESFIMQKKKGIFKRFAVLIFAACFLMLAGTGTKVQAASRWKKLQNKYREKKSTNRLIFVKYTGGTTCRVVMYKKVQKKSGKYLWKRILRCRGYVGYYGIGKTREGDRKTPVGIFKVTEAFGVLDNPGTTFRYTKLNPYLYWSGEEGTYNTMVDSRELGHIPDNSEHLISYQPHYNYALNIGYNKKNVFGKGSAIFLHCFGSNPYTGGCVAISEENMKTVLLNLTKKTRVCIYPE